MNPRTHPLIEMRGCIEKEAKGRRRSCSKVAMLGAINVGRVDLHWTFSDRFQYVTLDFYEAESTKLMMTLLMRTLLTRI